MPMTKPDTKDPKPKSRKPSATLKGCAKANAEGAGLGGRPAGSPNKATANAREAIGRLIDGNAARLQDWLDEIAENQGAQAAVKCFTDLIEYHVPKLARTEHTGKDGGPLIVQCSPEDEKL
jgi:hypothetical protein